jgi:hypothetical protein
VNGALGAASATIPIADSSGFPVSGWVLVDPDDATNVELVEYTSKVDSTNTLNVNGVTANPHSNGDEVILVDVLPLAEEGQNYFQLSNFPIQEGTPEIYHDATGVFTKYTDGVDYFLNRTNGQLKFFGAGLPVGTQVLGHHTYYTGLVQLAQKVVNGDKDDPVNYPGFVAAGIIIHIDTPTIRQITIIMSISVANGFDEEDVRDDVQLVVENYIDGLKIGENVILAKIIERAMSTRGVDNAKIQVPSNDVVILEEELPKSFDSSGNSLVTVA